MPFGQIGLLRPVGSTAAAAAIAAVAAATAAIAAAAAAIVLLVLLLLVLLVPLMSLLLLLWRRPLFASVPRARLPCQPAPLGIWLLNSGGRKTGDRWALIKYVRTYILLIPVNVRAHRGTYNSLIPSQYQQHTL